jgi:mannose-6-phosphate isomerase-like protein (cupin superfamily)
MESLRRAGDIPAYTGADGAHVQELAGRSTGVTSHSLALITHPAGTQSVAHHHRLADEIYFVQSGRARMRVDCNALTIAAGDLVTIRPGQSHKLWNDGPEDLVLVVTCAPAYDVNEVVWDE